jgi:hypothetical protein
MGSRGHGTEHWKEDSNIQKEPWSKQRAFQYLAV